MVILYQFRIKQIDIINHNTKSMKREIVSSSNIISIGYDEDSRILEIEFKKNRIYHYYDVPKNEFDGLMNASSHGSYLNENIKDVYDYEQIA